MDPSHHADNKGPMIRSDLHAEGAACIECDAYRAAAHEIFEEFAKNCAETEEKELWTNLYAAGLQLADKQEKSAAKIRFAVKYERPIPFQADPDSSDSETETEVDVADETEVDSDAEESADPVQVVDQEVPVRAPAPYSFKFIDGSLVLSLGMDSEERWKTWRNEVEAELLAAEAELAARKELVEATPESPGPVQPTRKRLFNPDTKKWYRVKEIKHAKLNQSGEEFESL